MYKKISIVDTLNIIKKYFNNNEQFDRKAHILQDKFFDIVKLLLTSNWYLFNSQFYQQTDEVLMWMQTTSTVAIIYLKVYEETVVSMAHHPLKTWE